MSSPLLQVSLDAGYGPRPVLQQVHLTLHVGERLGLIGGSGTGKSTLLLALLGLLPWRGGWARGEVTLHGQNLLELPERAARRLRGREIALIPQSPSSAWNSALSLQTHFEQAWKAHRPADSKRLGERTAELMRRVNLPSDPDFLRRRPGQISVGQAQRAVIALALLHRPSILVADEPTSALDPVTGAEVLRLLRDATEEDGAALLFVSHDLLSVVRLCSQAAVLHGGRILESVPVADLPYSQNPHTRTLLTALPIPLQVVLQHLQVPCQTATKVPVIQPLVTRTL